MKRGALQAAAGRKQANAAIDWINKKLKGRAVVAYINNDEIEFLRPRDQAIRETFAKAGIKIAVDQAPQQRTDEGGFNLMNSILQSRPDVNVVVSAPYVTAGVVSAITAAGIRDPDYYVSVGNPTDAELNLIAQGSVLREGLLFPFEPMCYAIGQLTNDWLAGKPVPRAITVPGGNLLVQGASGVAQYRADIADLRALYKSDRFRLYVGYWGTTRFEDMDKDIWRAAWQQADV